jgi:membrane associated rhomboid family serine protease
MFKNLPSLTRSLILVLAVALLTSLVTRGASSMFLALEGELAISHFQLWRLLTYPFASIGIFPVLTTCLLIFFFGAELETIVHTRTLTIFLTIGTIVCGLTIALLDPRGIVVAPGFLSMFLLTGFTYLWPKREVSIFGVFQVRVWVIAVVLFFFAIIPMDSTHMNFSLANLLPPFFAALSAVVLFHIKYRQYSFGRSLLSKADKALPASKPRQDARSVESEIDAILDKIGTNGMGSLTKQEREFLMRNTGR